MYRFLLRVRTGSLAQPQYELESSGFVKHNLDHICSLRDALYVGDGRLKIGRDAKETMHKSFGYLLGHDENGSFWVYRDRLGTFPLFMLPDRKNQQIVFFNRFYLVKEYWSEFTADKVGFWETVLFESTLGQRSMFANVLQIPCASRVRIWPDLGYEIDRYWHINYEIEANLTPKRFMGNSYALLNHVFSKLDPKRNYLVPISGGEDSRIMAAFISKYISKTQVRAVTYGYDDRLLEYAYAKQVMCSLDFDPPKFHKLTHKSYMRNLRALAESTGGCVSIQNSHLFDYISNIVGYSNLDILACTAYSDGILGFDATESDKKEGTMDNCQYYKILEKWKGVVEMSSDVVEAIESDLRNLYSEWKDSSSISSIDEYIYLVERNNKFHSYLADIAREYGEIFLPFTEPELVDYYFSIPNKYRFRKLGTINMVKKYFPAISHVQSIGSLFGKEGFKRPLRFTHFKFINYLNYLTAVLAKDKVHFVNPYQTERHGYNLRKYNRPSVSSAVDYLVGREILDASISKQLKKIPPRNSFNHMLRYQIINGAYVLGLFAGEDVLANQRSFS